MASLSALSSLGMPTMGKYKPRPLSGGFAPVADANATPGTGVAASGPSAGTDGYGGGMPSEGRVYAGGSPNFDESSGRAYGQAEIPGMGSYAPGGPNAGIGSRPTLTGGSAPPVGGGNAASIAAYTAGGSPANAAAAANPGWGAAAMAEDKPFYLNDGSITPDQRGYVMRNGQMIPKGAAYGHPHNGQLDPNRLGEDGLPKGFGPLTAGVSAMQNPNAGSGFDQQIAQFSDPNNYARLAQVYPAQFINNEISRLQAAVAQPTGMGGFNSGGITEANKAALQRQLAAYQQFMASNPYGNPR